MSLWSNSLADGPGSILLVNGAGGMERSPTATSTPPLSSTTRLLLMARSIRPHVAWLQAWVALLALGGGGERVMLLPSGSRRFIPRASSMIHLLCDLMLFRSCRGRGHQKVWRAKKSLRAVVVNPIIP